MRFAAVIDGRLITLDFGLTNADYLFNTQQHKYFVLPLELDVLTLLVLPLLIIYSFILTLCFRFGSSQVYCSIYLVKNFFFVQ